MCRLVKEIQGEERWQYPISRPGVGGKVQTKVRIETLLWGGDELIWVVPAWCGMEAVQFFFDNTNTKDAVWEVNGRRLTHAAGVVFCSCRAPIRSVVKLAKELAESVKDHLEDLSNGESEVAVQHRLHFERNGLPSTGIVRSIGAAFF